MPKCNSCKHYRPADPANSPVMALKWLEDSGEPEVYEEVRRISVQEYERNQGETQREVECRQDFIGHLDSNDDFGNPPSMTSVEKSDFRQRMRGHVNFQFATAPETVTHCAVHADRNLYYVPDLKNWGETCEDYESRAQLPLCRKCQYYQPSTVEAQQRAESEKLISAMASVGGSGGSILQQRASEIDRAIGPGKAHDLRTAYNAKGRLFGRLDYLPFCHAPCPSCMNRGAPDLECAICHGKGEQMAQPEIFNRFSGCQFFQPAAKSIPSSIVSGGHAMSLSPGPSPSHMMPGSTGTGGHVEGLVNQGVSMVFKKLRDVLSADPAQNVDPAEIPEASINVLVDGRPPLTNEMLRRSIAVVTELAKGTFPTKAERDYSSFVGQAWRQNNKEVIDLQLQFIGMYDGKRTDPDWHPRAKSLFQHLASMAMQAQSSPRGRSAAKPLSKAQPAPQAPAAPWVCKNGHQNGPDQGWCGECGKPKK